MSQCNPSDGRRTGLGRRKVLGLGSSAVALRALLPFGFGVGAVSRGVHGQDGRWPVRAVKIIVPVAAGTATDLTARIFADFLGPRWGQPIVVENRPGADGLLALGAFVQAADTHTLIFTFSTAVSLNPLIHARMPYDPDGDLVPLGTTSEVIFGIAAHGRLGVGTLDELVQKAKAAPGQINWVAAPGLPRFVFERFRRATGAELTYVPYQQTGNAVGDLIEGRIGVMIAAVSTLKPAIDSGKATVLAVTSRDRAALLPQVPSALEAGQPSLLVPALGCVFGSKDLTAVQRARIVEDLAAARADTRIVDRLAAIGQTVRSYSLGELQTLFKQQREELRPVAEALVGKR